MNTFIDGRKYVRITFPTISDNYVLDYGGLPDICALILGIIGYFGFINWICWYKNWTYWHILINRQKYRNIDTCIDLE